MEHDGIWGERDCMLQGLTATYVLMFQVASWLLSS